MTDKEAKKLVDKIFKQIKEATSIKALQDISDPLIEKNKMKVDVYPKLNFTISKLDIELLKNEGLLTGNDLVDSPSHK